LKLFPLEATRNRPELAHNRKREPGTELLMKKPQNSQAILDMPRQNQMTDKNAAFGGQEPRSIPRFQKAFGFHHFTERLQGDLRVSSIPHTHLCSLWLREFEIGEKNIHLLGIVFHPFRPLISGRVKKLWNFDPFFPKRAAERLDMRPEMVRRYEIQVVDTFKKKRPDFRKKLRGRDRATVVLDRNLIILTKKTLTGTAAKKDRPGTVESREGRLFPEMRSYERDAAGRTLPAET